MQFGVQFFPDVRPEERSGEQYFQEALDLAEDADKLGFSHVRIVEHYFHHYGGYSPNPIVFLAAAAQRTKRARLVTGAVLPAFNHPLKLAGEIAMLDAISNGRVEIGFARAFLPHEFSRFGVSVNESRERFTEGMEQVRRLLEEENVTAEGRYHSFKNVTSLPRPTQKPRPPFWVAAIATPQSFVDTGKAGHAIMAIPMAGGAMKELIGLYRQAWRDAGHPGNGRVMLAFHLFCHENRETAWQVARDPLNRYLRSLVDAASEWAGMESKDYPGYDKIIAALGRETIDTQVKSGAAWIGTPDDIAKQVEEYSARVGGFESASVQLNFNTVPYEHAQRSARLFAEKVMPRFAQL
jgi:natural product biosynthesis luciferase-like monooxygenase protein